ncbi:unnamed protein product [Paramecium octaurelia]|uniref:Uncharacterized protein n=1 Tax=Paramecium octaurelia TaxID=43137 RepID=A0A8S1VQI7_PAROT|nr:unnamed protein product [Paramecium octaurelia]
MEQNIAPAQFIFWQSVIIIMHIQQLVQNYVYISSFSKIGFLPQQVPLPVEIQVFLRQYKYLPSPEDFPSTTDSFSSKFQPHLLITLYYYYNLCKISSHFFFYKAIQYFIIISS